MPEVLEDFFVHAAPLVSVHPKEIRSGQHVYRIGRVPRTLWPIGERLEPRFGRLGREYKQIVFDKKLLTDDATLEWVTPGHPLFEAVREDAFDHVQPDLRRGAVFLDINRNEPARLDVFSAAIRDGRGNLLHRRLFIIECDMSGRMTARQPTMFLDLAVAGVGSSVPDSDALPARDQVERALIEQALHPFLQEVAAEREKEVETISRHLEISLKELIHRQSLRMADLHGQQQSGDNNPLTAANIKTTEDKLDELNGRLEGRREELQQERNCAITDIHHHGRAWVLPHPERTSPSIAPMVRDEEIERIAVGAAIAYEEARGWQVASVEAENRGFDLISRKPHPEDPQTAIEVRFIEVKGRAAVGEIGLTTNEYKTAERLKKDYWLYVVFNCATEPEVKLIRDPALLGWEPVVKVEHYHLGATEITKAVVDNLDEIEISIRIECDLSETRGSEVWDVKSVIDERDGSPLGDIGIYEFNARSEFSGSLMNAVLRKLNEEAGAFNTNLQYSVQVGIYEGGSLIGQASMRFSGKATLNPNFAREDF